MPSLPYAPRSGRSVARWAVTLVIDDGEIGILTLIVEAKSERAAERRARRTLPPEVTIVCATVMIGN